MEVKLSAFLWHFNTQKASKKIFVRVSISLPSIVYPINHQNDSKKLTVSKIMESLLHVLLCCGTIIRKKKKRSSISAFLFISSFWTLEFFKMVWWPSRILIWLHKKICFTYSYCKDMFETSQNIMELYATSIKILTCICRHKYEYEWLCDH